MLLKQLGTLASGRNCKVVMRKRAWGWFGSWGHLTQSPVFNLNQETEVYGEGKEWPGNLMMEDKRYNI